MRDTFPGLLSRIVRKAADQTSGCLNFLDAVNEGLLLVSEAAFRRTGTGDRGKGTVTPEPSLVIRNPAVKRQSGFHSAVDVGILLVSEATVRERDRRPRLAG